MLNDADKKLLDDLLSSLNNWTKISKNKVHHNLLLKETNSLYRFGIFTINDVDYSISGWKFKTNVVTFENEITGEKVKFDSNTSNVIYSTFKKDTFLKAKNKKIKNKISSWLRGLSDKLQS